MVVIFVGATLPSAETPTATVIGVGTVTGVVAGAVLGALSGPALPSVDGPPMVNAVLLQLLASPAHGLASRSLLGLQLTGSVTGRLLVLPVQYAKDDAGLVVLPGGHERKLWWRNLRGGAQVTVLLEGRWRDGRGRVLVPGDPGHAEASASYHHRWPRTQFAVDQPLVLVTVTSR
jgi:hypothetical protein